MVLERLLSRSDRNMLVILSVLATFLSYINSDPKPCCKKDDLLVVHSGRGWCVTNSDVTYNCWLSCKTYGYTVDYSLSQLDTNLTEICAAKAPTGSKRKKLRIAMPYFVCFQERNQTMLFYKMISNSTLTTSMQCSTLILMIITLIFVRKRTIGGFFFEKTLIFYFCFFIVIQFIEIFDIEKMTFNLFSYDDVDFFGYYFLLFWNFWTCFSMYLQTRSDRDAKYLLSYFLSNVELCLMALLKLAILLLLFLYKYCTNEAKSLQDYYYSNMPPYLYVLFFLITVNFITFLMIIASYVKQRGFRPILSFALDIHFLFVISGQYWMIRFLIPYYNTELHFKFSDVYLWKAIINLGFGIWCAATVTTSDWKHYYRQLIWIRTGHMSPMRF